MSGIPAGWEIEETGEALSPSPPATTLPQDAPVSEVLPPEAETDLPAGWEVESMGDEVGLEGTVSYDPEEFELYGETVNTTGRPKTGDASAMWHGLKSGALRGWDDEWQALFGAIGNKAGTAMGLNESTAGFWDIYDSLQHRNEQAKNDAWETNPVAYGIGFAPGMITGPSFAALTRSGGTIPQKVAGAMGIGGIEGAVSGAGNSEPGMDRLIGGVGGGATGALLAPLLLPFTGAASAVGSRIMERVRPRNHLNSGLEVLATRAPQDADAMTARVDAMEASGVPARLVDVVDESGRGVVRSTANKMTPARQELADHADTVYASAQDRVADQARRNITTQPRTARQLAREIAEEQKAMGPGFDAVRAQPVPVTPEMLGVLGTREGMAALRGAEGLMTDPAERAVVRGIMKAVRQSEKLGSPEEQARKLFPGFDNLSPEAQQQMIQQLDIKDPLEGIQMTVDIADKFARAMKGRASKTPGLERVAETFGNIVRQAARDASPGYAKVLDDYQDVARVGEAASGTGRFEDSEFLRTPPDEYARVVGDASATPAAVREGPEGFETPSVSERNVLAVRARDDVVDKATSGSGAQAMGVARQLSRGTGQRARNEALLGPDDAAKLEAGMANEVSRVDNTRFIDPRLGSKTQPMREDDEAVGEIGNFVADSTRGVWGIVHGAARWLRGAGIRGVDAERLTRDAISEDPQRVRDAIAFLTQKGLKIDRARSFVRALGAQAAGRAAGAALSGDADRPPPNSVRSVLREGGR